MPSDFLSDRKLIKITKFKNSLFESVLYQQFWSFILTKCLSYHNDCCQMVLLADNFYPSLASPFDNVHVLLGFNFV